MGIFLYKSELTDASTLHEMQVKSFMPLLEKYQDYETSPANESVERIADRINQSFTDYYINKSSDIAVGGIRVVKRTIKFIESVRYFILPEYQGRGIAQKVFKLVDQIYCVAKMWELDTILQEQENCYLYEKLGYKKTGPQK